jgi:hypothetical protein
MKQQAAILLIIVIVSVGCSQKSTFEWQYTTDINNDGQPEQISVQDLNANNRPDKIGDLHLSVNNDTLEARLWSEAEFDIDGEPDELRIYIDRDGNAEIDTAEGWLGRYIDLDDDGQCDDLDSDLHELDLTGEGLIHRKLRYQDFDRDGDADLLCQYPMREFFEHVSDYITSDRCMRQTWRGIHFGFGYMLHLDDDDDDDLNWDGDGAGTNIHRVRRPPASLGNGLEGLSSTGEAHRWYDFDRDGYTDMHLRDYGPGMMRWSFDWDGDAPDIYSPTDILPELDTHTDYDVAFHTLGEIPRGWWAGDQLKFWDFAAALDLPGYYREPGTAYDFGRDFVPASSSVYYTLQAPWSIISLNWLEDQEDEAGIKDVGCHRWEGIWSYYYDFNPKTAFIGSRRDFDRDANSNFQLYLSPIDSLYHLYEAEDGIWYRDPDCRRDHFMLRPTEDNIESYVSEIISYEDRDNDGFFDTFLYDRNLDFEPDEVISRPDADQAPLTDMTQIWRLGQALDSLYHPAEEDAPGGIDWNVNVTWESAGYDLRAKVDVTSSSLLNGYQLWLRAEEKADYNILCRTNLRSGEKSWSFAELIPRAQFILPGKADVRALLVNKQGRIVGQKPVTVLDIEPLNSPAMLIGFYRLWTGSPARDNQSFVKAPAQAAAGTGQLIKLELGLEFMLMDEATLVFEPYLTDETEIPRWILGKKLYRVSASELVADAALKLIPYGEEVFQAMGKEVTPEEPLSLDDYLGVCEGVNRIYVPPARTYRIGFRLWLNGNMVEDRVLYYDWLEGVPQTVRLES